MESTFDISPLNTLAFAKVTCFPSFDILYRSYCVLSILFLLKNHNPKCEITGLKAYFQLVTPYITLVCYLFYQLNITILFILILFTCLLVFCIQGTCRTSFLFFVTVSFTCWFFSLPFFLLLNFDGRVGMEYFTR